MVYLELPDNITRKLPFYLAMEEYAVTLPVFENNDLFFMWRVMPTVIYGRCQIGSKEVDLNYCRTKGIDVYRRKSGGGCVYADLDNIMFSYITHRSDSISSIFNSYSSKVAQLLQSLGLNASASSRNDILIDDKKVSGNAFYNTKDASIVHGTMLYSTNIVHMMNALTPSSAKIKAKGVTSVENRITTLNQHLDMPIDKFMDYVKTQLCSSTYNLTATDIEKIEVLARPYFSDHWRYGLDIKKGVLFNKRIEGVGEFFLTISLSENKTIKDIDLAGDFFITGDIDKNLIEPLIGLEVNYPALESALHDINVENIITGLSNKEYINLIIESSHE